MGRLPALGPLKRLGAMQPPQQQPIDPGEMLLDSMRARPLNPKDTPSAPFENPPFDAPKSVQGWIKNFGDDLTHFIEGIPAMVKMAYTEGKYLSRNLDGIKLLYDKPEFLKKELDHLRVQVVKGLTDHYKDGFGEALYKHPFSVLMDATAIFDIVGGGLKVAGKTALTAAERQALKAGAEIGGSLGAKLLRLGDNVQRTPGRIFAAPFQLAGRAALKVPAIQGAARRLALTPYGIARKDKMASYVLNERVKAAQMTEDLFKQSIPKKDWDEYWELATGYKPLEAASHPKLADHASRWKHDNAFNEEWMKEFGIKSQAELDQAALKPLVERLYKDGLIEEPWRFEKGRVVFNQHALDAAKAWVLGENPFGKPTQTSYMPYFLDRESSLLDLLDAAKSEAQTLRTVKRFEKKGVGGPIIKNPQEIQARATMQTAELRGVVNYVLDTIQTQGKTVKADKLPAGMVFMDPILAKYIENGLMPVHEAMVSKVAQELTAGASTYDALRNSARAVDNEMGDALLKAAREAADDTRNWSVAIPIEDAYLIESQLRGVSGPLRFYDKLMNTWRSVVLRLMPRYYMNNLLGNSILLMTGGHLPWSKTVADQKILPAEALSASGLLNETGHTADFISRLPGMKTVTRITDKLADITDTRPRGLLVETKLREIIAEDAQMGDTIAGALLAQGSMDDAVKAALAARKEIFELTGQQAIQAKRVSLQLGEEKRLQSIDRKMDDLQKQIDTERSLSNAGTARPQADVSALEAEIQSKIAQNAPVAEIRRLQEQIRRAQAGRQAATGGGTEKLTELQEQLKKLGAQREATVGAYPYSRPPGGIGEDVQKLLDISARRQALAPVAAKVERAVSEMERFLGNYGRLHPIAREWVRRAIPFWTFLKTMNMLLFQLPFIRPKTAFLWNQFSKLMLDGANDDRLPRRFRNMLPLGSTQDGQMIFMRVSGFNPFESVQSTEIGGVRIPKLIDPASNPFVTVLIETRGGYDTFTEKPFVEYTDFVALDGTVWRYDPKTNVLEPVIPQKPLVSALLNQIPHVRVVKELLDSFPGTRGAAQVTRQDPEGRYFYDRSPLWAASRALGFPISVSDPERVKAQHGLLIKGMIKRFQSAARRVDPDQREKLLHILNNLGSDEVELREW